MKKEGKYSKNLHDKNVSISHQSSSKHSYFFAEIQDIFLKIIKKEEDISVGVAAIKTLLAVIEQYKGISQ